MSDETQQNIRRVLLEILSIGLLRIRGLAQQENSVECFIEADHLHNIPDIIEHLRTEYVRSYYESYRLAFLDASNTDTSQFGSLWTKLGELLAVED